MWLDQKPHYNPMENVLLGCIFPLGFLSFLSNSSAPKLGGQSMLASLFLLFQVHLREKDLVYCAHILFSCSLEAEPKACSKNQSIYPDICFV